MGCAGKTHRSGNTQRHSAPTLSFPGLHTQLLWAFAYRGRIVVEGLEGGMGRN